MTQKKLTKSSKTALITGGAKRIGKEIAIKLAEIGYNIVISYKQSELESQELANFLKKKYQIKVFTFKADLFKNKDAEKLAKYMIDNFSDWSLLINNASIFEKSNFFQIAENFEKNFAVHFSSPLILINKFAEYINSNKNISNPQVINMLDKNIERFETKYFYYLLTKKFLAQSIKMIALQVAPRVRINGIALGYFLANEYDLETKEYVKNLQKKIPMQRIGNIENITLALEFLIENKFITGEILTIDGGASLNDAG